MNAKPARTSQPDHSTHRLEDYLEAVCRYHRALADEAAGRVIPTESKKKRQLALSTLLARVVASDLRSRGVTGARAGEIQVAGALSAVQVDVVEATVQDGLKLGIEVKTINEAAGRAMWNRVGDFRSFAVNYHLKFPYAVLGAVLSVPAHMAREPNLLRLIGRAEQVLTRVNRRPDEGSAPHRLEGIALLVFECADDGVALHPTVPSEESGLRYPQFIQSLLSAHAARFFQKPHDSGADEA